MKPVLFVLSIIYTGLTFPQYAASNRKLFKDFLRLKHYTVYDTYLDVITDKKYLDIDEICIVWAKNSPELAIRVISAILVWGTIIGVSFT